MAMPLSFQYSQLKTAVLILYRTKWSPDVSKCQLVPQRDGSMRLEQDVPVECECVFYLKVN